MLDFVVIGTLNKFFSDEYLFFFVFEGVVLVGGVVDWVGVKLVNSLFIVGVVLVGVLDIGKREFVKLFLVFI